jgi:hypothetical protein
VKIPIASPFLSSLLLLFEGKRLRERGSNLAGNVFLREQRLKFVGEVNADAGPLVGPCLQTKLSGQKLIVRVRSSGEMVVGAQ